MAMKWMHVGEGYLKVVWSHAFEGIKHMMKHMKEVVGGKVEKVVGARMAVSPCVLTTSEYGWSAIMERIMEDQALRDNSMASYMASKKMMEVKSKILYHERAEEEGCSDTSLLTPGFIPQSFRA